MPGYVGKRGVTAPTAFKTGGAGPRGNAPKGGASTVPPVEGMGSRVVLGDAAISGQFNKLSDDSISFGCKVFSNHFT